MVELAWFLAEIGQAGSTHAREVPAEGGEGEIKLQDLALVESPFQLKRAQALPELTGEAAGGRLDQPRGLHGERRGARHHPPRAQVLPGGAQHRQRIHTGMVEKAAVLECEQRLQIARRDLLQSRPKSPVVVGAGEDVEQLAIPIRYFGGIERSRGQRRREQAVEQKERPGDPGERRQREADPTARESHGPTMRICEGFGLSMPYTQGRYMSSARAAGT